MQYNKALMPVIIMMSSDHYAVLLCPPADSRYRCDFVSPDAFRLLSG
ncbi:hypothetical protein [Erwinia sp. V71]